MFFEPHLRTIYLPPGGTPCDPLAVLRALTVQTGGRVDEWLADYSLPTEKPTDPAELAALRGPVLSPDVLAENRVLSAQAEAGLARAARVAFGVPAFPAGTDADALAALFDFLDWLEKKGQRADRPPS